MDLGAPASYLTLNEGTPVFSSDREQIGVVEHVLALALVAVDECPRILHVDPGGPDGVAGRRAAPAGVTDRTSERGDGPLSRFVAWLKASWPIAVRFLTSAECSPSEQARCT